MATPTEDPGRAFHHFSDKKPFSYINSALRSLTLPLGGVGTGSIALAGDGGLRQWQIVNNVNHDAHVPYSFFALCAGGWPIGHHAVILQSDKFYEDDSFRPAPSISDHLIPEYSRRLLQEFPGVDELEITARYPIVEVFYQVPSIPVDVKLRALNPFIPLNSWDSGIPAILFTFTVTNTSDVVVDGTLMAAQQNIVGWDGRSTIDGIANLGYGGNVNHLISTHSIAAIDMRNSRLDLNHPQYGNLLLGVYKEPDIEVSTLLQWRNVREVWEPFSRFRGRLPGLGGEGSSSSGETWNGSIAAHFKLRPGDYRNITFILCWHFPNRYVTWDQRPMGVKDQKSSFWIGNHYSKLFGDAIEVAEYVRTNFDRLVNQTLHFRDAFFTSSLTDEILNSVAGPISTIRSPTCFWIADGRFYGFEGCQGASTPHGSPEGCCPLNCTHVWNYEMALSRLFPDLEQTMRWTDLMDQMSPAGEIPHRTPLPLYLPRPLQIDIGGPQNPAVDGELGSVLKTYREVLHGADRSWFDKVWPRIKILMDHIMEDHDAEGDGIIRGEQPNTYDISIYGPNTFIGSLYLAALRAAEEMALLQDEIDLAKKFRSRFETGSDKLDELCWNGEYYIQVVDLGEHSEYQYGQGCHIDQLLGQWWAHILDLGRLLPEEHIRWAIRSIVKYNHREGFALDEQKPRIYLDESDSGLFNCTWPNGGMPEVPINYAHEVWSGTEHVIAGLMFFEGMIEEGMSIVSDIRKRHDGTRRSPWNEVECGDHYVRAMSSWAYLEALSGIHYNAPIQRLRIHPMIDDKDFRFFFITGTGWGNVSYENDTVVIKLTYGELKISKIFLKSDEREVVVHKGGKKLDLDSSIEESFLKIHFSETTTISKGEELVISPV